MTYRYVYFPQEVAGFLKGAGLAWDDIWPALSKARAMRTGAVVQFNTIDFAYNPERDQFQVAVNFGDKDAVWLTEEEFKQEVPQWVEGGPKC
ncbi:hypothetical protein [Tropicibacter alexandrii]|uniref:hypothetical protein n=1 Tax=Tropicibacter alexandrii TaxID=2267683 RepID=UPI001008E5BA|nr:hypothetical protein [Tropicibacter alexandrii]